MTRSLLLPAITVAFGCIAVAQVAATAPKEEPLPAAETILDRYIEVTGGKGAYEKRKNMVATGTMEFKAQGLKGSITRYSGEPAEEYSIVDIEGVGKVEEGVDKGIAWEKNPMLGPRLKTGVEKAQALRESIFNSPIHWREMNKKVETTGAETIDGELCYKVVLTPNESPAETMYFQKKSGLAVKSTTIAASPMGDIPVEMLASDYKNMGGILEPTKTSITQAGQEITIAITDEKINQPIPADRFAPPADIKALIDKAAK